MTRRLCTAILLPIITGLLMGSPCSEGNEDMEPDPPAGDDADADGVTDAEDNCPADANAAQGDVDGDALGDACDLCPIDPLHGAADDCELTEACAIEGVSDGMPLGDPPQALAASYVTLNASPECGTSFDFKWVHGLEPDLSVYSTTATDFFLLHAIEHIELQVLYQDQVLVARPMTLEAKPMPVAADLLGTPSKPTTFQSLTVTVSAWHGNEVVPVMDHPDVLTVDYTLTRLEQFLPTDTVISRLGETSSSIQFPPQPAGWYRARAIVRGLDGTIVGTPPGHTIEFKEP